MYWFWPLNEKNRELWNHSYLELLRVRLRVFMVVNEAGTSRIVNCSDLVGVTTVVVPPCQELLSSLIKLLRFPLAVSLVVFAGAAEPDVGAVGGKGTTKPSFSIFSSLSIQLSDWKSSVNSLLVVGVRASEVVVEVVEAVSQAPTNDPRLTFCVLFWTMISDGFARVLLRQLFFFSSNTKVKKLLGESLSFLVEDWGWITRQTSGWLNVSKLSDCL